MVLSIPKYGLCKNLTMQLVVTGKDWVIYPKFFGSYYSSQQEWVAFPSV